MNNKDITNNLINKIKIKDITELDLNKTFFHYTNILNLDDILKKGWSQELVKMQKGWKKVKKYFLL
jgi:hypothetical protein